MKPWTLRLTLALLVLATAWLGVAAAPDAPPALTVYLVRHAEKELTSGLPTRP
ncbi:hypothetical protein [Hymenobacter coccineus]|uniref:hypothetical protein n=1 Tax=Hymenobacter coccineus TaxID=1908235 RepID=UPI0013014114|nr:hypothetical protein [Hymenobacter coccineus]